MPKRGVRGVPHFWPILSFLNRSRRAVGAQKKDLEKRFSIKKFLKKWSFFQKNSPAEKTRSYNWPWTARLPAFKSLSNSIQVGKITTIRINQIFLSKNWFAKNIFPSYCPLDASGVQLEVHCGPLATGGSLVTHLRPSVFDRRPTGCSAGLLEAVGGLLGSVGGLLEWN